MSLDGVLVYPWQQLIKITAIIFQQSNQELMCIIF
jgi:hypothetical protein